MATSAPEGKPDPIGIKLNLKLPPAAIHEKQSLLLDFTHSEFLTNFHVKVKVCDDPPSYETIAANKDVLASSSSYFLNNFVQKPSINEMVIDGFRVETVEKLLGFFYLNEISIDLKEFPEMMKLAKLLEVEPVLKHASENLSSYVNASNILRIRDIFVWMNAADGIQTSEKFIKENFEEVSKTTDFKMMNYRYLLELVQSDDLVVSDEKTLYKVILQWIDVDKGRISHGKVLLSHVRFPLMPESNLQEIQYDPIIDDDQNLTCLLRDSLYYLQSGNYKLGGRSHLKVEHKTRRKKLLLTADSSEDICCSSAPITDEADSTELICVGGCWNNDVNNGLLNSIEYSSDGGRTWQMYGQLHPARSHFTANIWYGFIVFAGGLGTMYSCTRYHIKTKSHIRLSKLPNKRHSHASAIIGNRLFVAGGDEYHVQNTLISLDLEDSFYDPSTSWDVMESMNFKRNGPSMCPIHQLLICLGGRNQKSCEIYNQRNDEWTIISPMRVPRFKPSCCFDDKNSLYVAGGTDGLGQPVTTIEKLDTDSFQWTAVEPPSLIQSYGVALTYCNESLYLIGGEDGKDDYAGFVQKLKLDEHGKQQWILQGSLIQARSFHCVVSVAENEDNGEEDYGDEDFCIF